LTANHLKAILFARRHVFPSIHPRHSEAIIFSVKAAVATVVAALVYEFVSLPGAPWVAAVSAVLVTQPDLHSSLKASLLRVAANVAGAFGGAVLLVLIRQPIVAMACGVILTGLVCYFFDLDDAQRPAFVAVIIVALFPGSSGWHSSLTRIFGVILGCLCALVVGFLFDKLTGTFKLPGGDKSKPSE
jgi:uncharacterized membrane protein YgaE (UPF0421/DUF939 family)